MLFHWYLCYSYPLVIALNIAHYSTTDRGDTVSEFSYEIQKRKKKKKKKKKNDHAYFNFSSHHVRISALTIYEILESLKIAKQCFKLIRERIW